MTDHIFEMGLSFDEKYPKVNYSNRKNRQHDWLRLGEMLRGAEPMDEAFVAGIDIDVRTRQPFDVLDIACWPVISGRARSLLVELGLEGVRFVPGLVNGKPFYHLIPPTIDCLDRERSELEFFADSDRVMMIHRYVFHKERIPDPSIFCIPESRYVFATDAVERAVVSSGLVGFRFTDWENPPPGTFVG